MVGDSAWSQAKLGYPVGSFVRGTVSRVEPFGVFVSVTGCEAPFLLLVTEFEDGDRGLSVSEYPALGSPVYGRVVDHASHNRQIRITTKASRMS
jgi:ribosomal protein S1